MNRARHDGLQHLCKPCKIAERIRYYKDNKPAHAKYRSGQREKRLKRFFDFAKRLACRDCGLVDPIVLEFDHVRGKKIASVGDLVSGWCSWEKVVREVAKCDPVCANCHRRRTARRAGWFSTRMDL